MDLSLCILSFNTCADLENTLRAARAAVHGLAAELIVVDNGSRDGSVAMLREEFPEARLVENPENRFFSAATNQALAIATGRYILNLNSDVTLLPGAVEEMTGYLGFHSDVGAVTGRMTYPDGQLQRTCAQFSSFPYFLLEHTFLGLILNGRARKLRQATCYGEWDRSTARQVDVLPGSFIMTRREVLLSVGSHDERFRLYFSDDDWCNRLSRAGFRAVYLPTACGIHQEGASTRQLGRLARRIFFEDMIAYAAKYFGRWPARWLWLLCWPSRLGRELKATLNRTERRT